jgi:hypothetical protein
MKSLAVLFLFMQLATSAQAAAAGALTQTEADRLQDGGKLPPERPERHVILMPVVGVWNHPFEQGGWTATPSPVWGLDVKIEPFSWLGVRASALRGNQRLEIGKGLWAQTADAYQPTLEITQLQLRAEPTLRWTRSLSSYVGLAIGWGRFIAPESVTSPRLHTYNRTAVYVVYEGAIGIAWEPRVDWLVLDLSIGASLLSNQSGSAHNDVQAFTDAGQRTTMSGLSKSSAAYRAMFGIGFIL